MNCGVILHESNLHDDCRGVLIQFHYNCKICKNRFSSRFPIAAQLCGDCYAKIREN